MNPGMILNWNFLGGGEVQNKKPYVEEYECFLELHNVAYSIELIIVFCLAKDPFYSIMIQRYFSSNMLNSSPFFLIPIVL